MYKPLPEATSVPTLPVGTDFDGTAPVMLTVEDIAAILQLSTRSVWRLRSAGGLPAPVRLGGLVRWRKSDIEAWIADGCPPAADRDGLRDRRRLLQ